MSWTCSLLTLEHHTAAADLLAAPHQVWPGAPLPPHPKYALLDGELAWRPPGFMPWCIILLKAVIRRSTMVTMWWRVSTTILRWIVLLKGPKLARKIRSAVVTWTVVQGRTCFHIVDAKFWPNKLVLPHFPALSCGYLSHHCLPIIWPRLPILLWPDLLNICKPWRWLSIKIPVDQQCVNFSTWPVWQPAMPLNLLSSPFWCWFELQQVVLFTVTSWNEVLPCDWLLHCWCQLLNWWT